MPTFCTVSFPARAIDELPPELLIEICSINARPETPWPNHYLHESNINKTVAVRGLPQDILDTIHASHVCRRWREILVSVPRFWKNMVDPYDAEWSNMILKRSAPLDITFAICRPPYGGRDIQHEFSAAEFLRERLAEYHLKPEPMSSLEDVLVFPALKVLSLRGPAQFPPTFPGEATPVLETLHISHCKTPGLEITAISRTLTRLFVISPCYNRGVGFWGHLMSQLPRLEVIALKLCFAMVDKDWVDTHGNFQTNVVEFAVHDSAMYLIAFMPRIQFGESLTLLKVECPADTVRDTDKLPDLESHLIQTFSNKARRIFQHDTLGHAGIWVFNLYFETHLHCRLLNPPQVMPSLDNDKGMRNRWFMDISCRKHFQTPFIPPTLQIPGTCSQVDVLNISHFKWLWEDLRLVLCKFTNLQIFRITQSLISRFMLCVNSSQHSANIFPFLRGIYLDIDDLVVSGYRDVFLSNTGSDDESEVVVECRTSIVLQNWSGESDDYVEAMAEKGGNPQDNHSFIDELESTSVEQIVHFCKARPSIQFVSLLDVPEKEAFVILRERLGEMGIEIRKHDEEYFDMLYFDMLCFNWLTYWLTCCVSTG